MLSGASGSGDPPVRPAPPARGFSCQCGRAGSAIVRGFPAKLGSDRQGRINPSSPGDSAGRVSRVEGLAVVPLVLFFK